MRIRSILKRICEERQEPRGSKTRRIHSFPLRKNSSKLLSTTKSYLKMLCQIRKANMQQPIVLVKQQFKPLKLLGKQPLQVVFHQWQKAFESQFLIFEVQQQKSYYVIHPLAVRSLRVVVRITTQEVFKFLFRSY